MASRRIEWGSAVYDALLTMSPIGFTDADIHDRFLVPRCEPCQAVSLMTSIMLRKARFRQPASSRIWMDLVLNACRTMVAMAKKLV